MLTVEPGDYTTHLTRGKLPVVLDRCDSALEVQKLLVPLQSHTTPVPSAEEKQRSLTYAAENHEIKCSIYLYHLGVENKFRNSGNNAKIHKNRLE